MRIERDGQFVLDTQDLGDGRTEICDGIQRLYVPNADLPGIVEKVAAVPDRDQIPGGVLRRTGLYRRYIS